MPLCPAQRQVEAGSDIVLKVDSRRGSRGGEVGWGGGQVLLGWSLSRYRQDTRQVSLPGGEAPGAERDTLVILTSPCPVPTPCVETASQSLPHRLTESFLE